jgi:heme/copper-type cytochrome/quinol oxidase subunit 2
MLNQLLAAAGWPLLPKQQMQNSAYTFLVVPLIGWLSVVSLLVVAYLATLAIEERRRNRRMDQERERLGLRRA